MTRDHFLDLQESGGEWWLEGWRCINCGDVFDPVLERNRRLHALAVASPEAEGSASVHQTVAEEAERPIDLAA